MSVVIAVNKFVKIYLDYIHRLSQIEQWLVNVNYLARCRSLIINLNLHEHALFNVLLGLTDMTCYNSVTCYLYLRSEPLPWSYAQLRYNNCKFSRVGACACQLKLSGTTLKLSLLVICRVKWLCSITGLISAGVKLDAH